MKTNFKKIIALIALIAFTSAGVFSKAKAKSKNKLVIYSFTDEVPSFVQKYIKLHPDFPYTPEIKLLPNYDGQYQFNLENVLKNSKDDVPDIYVVDNTFLYSYTKGDMEKYSLPYINLGIDEKVLMNAEIAPYTVDLGTNNDGILKGLTYQSTAGCFIYRRSLARKVFGTDDPEEVQRIIGGGTGNWDKFLRAARTCADNGVAILSGIDDLWIAMQCSGVKGWVVDNKLYISPEREAFLDLAKTFVQNQYTNMSNSWQDSWFADMKGYGSRPVLGYFGPAWFVSYTLAPNCNFDADGTYGDWAVCLPPAGFYWGASYIFVNKNVDEKKLEAIKQLIQWMTVDTSEQGLLYNFANGKESESTSSLDSVPSNIVLSKSNGKCKVLQNQNMFDYFKQANNITRAKTFSAYDEVINYIWLEEVLLYANGCKTREGAISDFKQRVSTAFGL